MLERLHELVALLRKNGVRASTAEFLDALSAVRLVGFSDRQALHDVLSTSLIKRVEDQSIFDDLFRLMFVQPSAFLRPGAAPLLDALRSQGLSEDELEHVLARLTDQAARLDPTARMALGLQQNSFEALLRLAGIQLDLGQLANPLQIGYYTQRLLEQLRFGDAQAQLNQLVAGLGGSLGGARAAEIGQLLQQNLDTLRASARAHIKAEFARKHVRYPEDMRQQILSEKPLSQLTLEDLAKLKREVERMAEKLRTQASLRPRKRRRGRLDMRRTLRRALTQGGLPFRIYLRHRRIEKPRLCILCDISDSVRHVSRFMLQFVYTLQDLFSKVRAFVFVSDLGEATDLFARHDLDQAVHLAQSGAVINVYANSNYGRALRQFVERYLEAITTRTTVLIIGDGRNNYFPSEAWAVGRLRDRARAVLWLTPEQPASWVFGDSAMHDYKPHCTRIEVVHNLDSLRKVIDGLIL